MIIIKPGKANKTKTDRFFFRCKNCGCEWYADRDDKELSISPPYVGFYAYMNCPNCGYFTFDKR